MNPVPPLLWITNQPKSLKSLWPRRAGVTYIKGDPHPTDRFNTDELKGFGLVGIYVAIPAKEYWDLPLAKSPKELEKLESLLKTTTTP